jgi:hypothetical protein
MKRLLPLFLLFALLTPAAAQQTQVVADCAATGKSWSVNDLGRPLLLDPDGVLCTNATGGGGGSTASTKVSTSALASGLVVRAAAGNLAGFNVSANSTLSAAAWWIMVFDATSAPADGVVTPAKCYAMASGVTSFSAGFTSPEVFATGITIVVSTTGCFTKTASVNAFISGAYQ